MLYILGAGSLGLLWAARLQQAGIACRVIVRNAQQLEAWQQRNNRLLFNDGNGNHALTLNFETPDTTRMIRHLIVATKAHAALEAVRQLRHRLRPAGDILMLQNGLGSQQAVAQACRAQQVFAASVTDGAWQPAPGELTWAGRGSTVVGPLDSGAPCPEWLNRLPPALFDWRWQTPIMPTLWRKLAINCAINPFTLIYNCHNGEVPTRAGPWLDTCLTELQELLRAQGVTEELAPLVHDVIRSTAANSSSMRQDLHAGRRTEIDYILGYACRQARQNGLQVPALERLLDAAKDCLRRHQLPTD